MSSKIIHIPAHAVRSDKKVERILRSRGAHDRNGFPILDPPESRNKLPKPPAIPVDTDLE